MKQALIPIAGLLAVFAIAIYFTGGPGTGAPFFGRTLTNSSATIQAVGTTVVAENTSRSYFQIWNNSPQPVYCNLKAGAGTGTLLTTGIRLDGIGSATSSPASTWSYRTADLPWVGPISCISSATATVTYIVY